MMGVRVWIISKIIKVDSRKCQGADSVMKVFMTNILAQGRKKKKQIETKFSFLNTSLIGNGYLR